MTTFIRITGQPWGNRILLNALTTIDSKSISTNYGFEVEYPTKTDAKKALRGAKKQLIKVEPDYCRNGGMRYSKDYSIMYDTSKAIIV